MQNYEEFVKEMALKNKIRLVRNDYFGNLVYLNDLKKIVGNTVYYLDLGYTEIVKCEVLDYFGDDLGLYFNLKVVDNSYKRIYESIEVSAKHEGVYFFKTYEGAKRMLNLIIEHKQLNLFSSY